MKGEAMQEKPKPFGRLGRDPSAKDPVQQPSRAKSKTKSPTVVRADTGSANLWHAIKRLFL